MRYTIATIPGDGIGPDVVSEAVRVLRVVAKISGFGVQFTEVLMGGAAIDATGSPLPESTIEACRAADAVLLGAVGGPRWDGLPGNLRPEAGLLGLRAAMGAYANLRPARIFPELTAACPLKPEIVGEGLDLLIVRELTGGIYFGERGTSPNGEAAWDTERYTRAEIERLLEIAYRAARTRKKKLCVVDKANVLESSRLWRRTAQEFAKRYSEVETSFMYVDNCAMQLIRNPRQFDVVATSNMFGDILSDEASMITGSIGMLPSASIGSAAPASSNPSTVLRPISQAKIRRIHSRRFFPPRCSSHMGLDARRRGNWLNGRVSSVLAAGYRCADIATGAPGETVLGTRAMGEMVARAIEEDMHEKPQPSASTRR